MDIDHWKGMVENVGILSIVAIAPSFFALVLDDQRMCGAAI